VRGRGKLGVQPHVDAAPPLRAQPPLAEPLIQLGQDAAGRLDQHPAQLGRVQRRVEPDRLADRLESGTGPPGGTVVSQPAAVRNALASAANSA
jgi:hypothetical protein